jgi:hypothetical protein
LLYCLDDGSALLEGPASMDEPATAFLQQPQSEPQTALINSVAPNKSGETRAWTPDPSGKSDTLLLLDFDNTTGEEIFDHT